MICKTSVISHRTSTDVLQKWDTTVSRLGKNFVLSRDQIFPQCNKFKYTVMRSKSQQTLPPSHWVPMPFNSSLQFPGSWVLCQALITCALNYNCLSLYWSCQIIWHSGCYSFVVTLENRMAIMNSHGLITLLKQLSTQGLPCFTEINFEKTLKSE